MQNIRTPAVAGTFYPGNRQLLTDTLAILMGAASDHAGTISSAPKALIVPHAGYQYSGSTAALAYAQLAPARASIKRVVLLGPVHRVPVRGLAYTNASAFRTPLGEVPLDQNAIASITHFPQVVLSPAAHAPEHSLEVQLPFLQSVLNDFSLVPLAVGDATPDEVAQVLDALWGGPETLIVVSSDLSHFRSYASAQAFDQATVNSILTNDPTLSHEQACGGTPINGLLRAASRHHLKPQLLGACNSGDTAGDRNRVVGYAAFSFAEVPHAAG